MDTSVKRKVGHGYVKTKKRPSDVTTKSNSKTNKARLMSQPFTLGDVGDKKLNLTAKRIMTQWTIFCDLFVGILASLDCNMYSEQFYIFAAGSSPMLVQLIILEMFGLLFPLGDYDVMITGSDEDFQMILYAFEYYCQRTGISCTKVKKKNSYTGCSSIALSIVNYCVEGLDNIVSFIWHVEASSPSEVFKTFDIDICRVGYCFQTQKFLITEEVKRAIVAREATVVKEFKFAGTVAAPHEVAELASTMYRMSKYKSRGFNFAQPPTIKFGDK